jgi:signal transduction histidine kinase
MASSVNSGGLKSPDRVTMPPLWFRVATAVLAVAIFVADTATDFEVSVSVLYVIVVLMASRFLQRRGTAYVAGACVALTTISAILTPPQGTAFTGVANTLISTAAIIITTFLVLQSQARELVLKEHIEERKRAEKELERLRQIEADLAHMNRVTQLGELAASVSHELKQPIAAAVTNAQACLQILAAPHPDLAEARAASSAMIGCTKRAAEIIDRLRTLFKKGTPQREPLDVNEVIREMTVLLQDEARRHAAALRMELAENLPPVMGDRVQLQQVVMNLMLNGIEAMHDTRGELRVASRQADHGQVVISVSDTGVGLPPEKAHHIFDAFFTTKPEGTGMGLAICRSIVESHGGRIWATPNSERGTTFHFTLPATITDLVGCSR